MTDIPKLSERYKKNLVQNGTIGDGKTLCCSVDVVAEMFEDCEEAGACVGAFNMMERLYPLLSPETRILAKAYLEEMSSKEMERKQAMRQRRKS